MEVIENSAFYESTSIKGVDFSDSLREIKESAFYKSGIQGELILGDTEGLRTIGSFAFAYCSSITSLTIKEGVENVGSYAFQNCISIRNFVIETKDVILGSNVIDGCNQLKTITVPVELSYPNSNTFKGSKIETIHYTVADTGIMPDRSGTSSDINYYGKTLECGSIETLTTVIYDEGITHIGAYAYNLYRGYVSSDNKYGKLNNIRFPSTLTSIGNYAFAYQKSLHAMLFHGDQVTISSSAFTYCPADITVYGHDQGAMYAFAQSKNYYFVAIDKPVIEEGKRSTASGLQLELHATVCTDIDTYVSEVEWEVQNQTSSSTKINTDGVLQVGEDEQSETLQVIAKWNGETDSADVNVAVLYGLNAFTLPENLIRIEEEAFQGLPAEVLYIPQSCIEIDSRAFADCQQIKYVVVYDKDAIEIADDAFEDVGVIFIDR